MKKTAKGIYRFTRQVFHEYIADNVLKYSASLSYYTIISLGPLLVLIITFTSIIYKEDALKGELYESLKEMIGSQAAIQIQEGIKNITFSTDITFANIVSAIVLFIGATGIFAEMQDSLNKIWGLKLKARSAWWKILTDRLLSFSHIKPWICIAGFLALNALVSALSSKISEVFGATGSTIIIGLNTAIGFIISTLLFATIFKVLPDARIKWKDVFVGAIITALLFALGKYVIGLYIGNSKFTSVYSTAGTVMIMMVWVYYSSAILYLGAVFTKVYATNHGSKIYPSEYSVWIKTEEIPVSHVTLHDDIAE